MNEKDKKLKVYISMSKAELIKEFKNNVALYHLYRDNRYKQNKYGRENRLVCEALKIHGLSDKDIAELYNQNFVI